MIKIKHLYIHIPVSTSKCDICDEGKIEDFSVDSIVSEIKNEKLSSNLKTLYIGGLNPGDLSLSSLEKLLKCISKRFDNIDEFTFETYPHSLSDRKILMLKKYCINRIVLKTKTFDAKLLSSWTMLGNVETSFSKLKKQGFKNISLDMNFGFGQKILHKDIEQVLSLKPESIHWYSHSLQGPVEDLQIISRVMKKNSYHRYELTGFAKKGFESKHTIAYLKSNDWIGIGPAASSFIQPNYNDKKLSNTDLSAHIIMMAFQYEKGLDLNLVHHEIAYKSFKDKIDFAIEKEWLKQDSKFIFIDKDKWEDIDIILQKIL